MISLKCDVRQKLFKNYSFDFWMVINGDSKPYRTNQLGNKKLAMRSW